MTNDLHLATPTQSYRELLAHFPAHIQDSLAQPEASLSNAERTTLSSYVSQLLAALVASVPHWLATRPAQSAPAQYVDATVLMVEIDGLPALFDQQGLYALNHIFDLIMYPALTRGGDPLMFGDGTLALAFSGANHAAQATAAAFEMQSALRNMTLLHVRERPHAPLLRVALASGPLTLVAFGEYRLNLALGGVFQRCEALVHSCWPGEICLDAAATAGAAHVAQLERHPSGSTRLIGLGWTPSPPRHTNLAPAGDASIGDMLNRISTLAPFVSDDTFHCLASNPRELPAMQLQIGTVLATQLTGLDQFADQEGAVHPALLAEVVATTLDTLQTVISEYGGRLIQLDRSSIGHRLLVLFASSDTQAAVRAVQTALALRGAVQRTNRTLAETLGDGNPAQQGAFFRITSGIDSGQTITSTIGTSDTSRRWEQITTGTAVVRASQLMEAGELGASEVLMSQAMHASLNERLIGRHRTMSLEGQNEPVDVWSIDIVRPY